MCDEIMADLRVNFDPREDYEGRLVLVYVYDAVWADSRVCFAP